MNRMRTWSLGAAGLAFLVLVAGWFLLISPTKAKVSDLQTQTAAQLQTNAGLDNLARPAQAAEQEPAEAGGEAREDSSAPAGDPCSAHLHPDSDDDRPRLGREARPRDADHSGRRDGSGTGPSGNAFGFCLDR